MKIIERSTDRSASGRRSWRELDSPQALAIACVVVPLLFGVYSVWLGADANWDLTNYHLYNPFAWLNGRLQTDLAPAGMQSYFNPLLDVPFYWMSQHLAPRLVGFAMGVLHGLNFVLLLAITRRVLSERVYENRRRFALLLSLAGALTPCYLSQIGNTMGDNATALFVLAGLLVLVTHWEALAATGLQAALAAMAAGLLVGMGAGLKPTTACYAVGMCIALLGHPGPLAVRLRVAFLFGIGVLLGWIVTGGYWMLHMWQLFGNPLYPQFSKFFPNPLTAPIASGDVRFIPHGVIENLFWPFIMGGQPGRVTGLSREIVWPIVYGVLLFALGAAIIRRIRRREGGALASHSLFVVLFVAVSYVVWMRVFSIYRYLVPIEMLTPLVVFVLLTSLMGVHAGRRAAKRLIGAMAVVGMVGAMSTWGHEGWSDPLYRVDAPPIADPQRATVVIYSMNDARGWMVPFFPREVAFASLGSSFPESDAFGQRVRTLVSSRGGEGFALVDGVDDWRARSAQRVDRIVHEIGLTTSERGCTALKWAVMRFHLHASVQAPAGDGRVCRIAVRADDAQKAIDDGQRKLDRAVQAFARAKLTLEPATCKVYNAHIGTGTTVYRLCRVKPN